MFKTSDLVLTSIFVTESRSLGDGISAQKIGVFNDDRFELDNETLLGTSAGSVKYFRSIPTVPSSFTSVELLTLPVSVFICQPILDPTDGDGRLVILGTHT